MSSFTRPSTKSATGTGLPSTNSSGFTLLELLVSLTIFSLVIGMAMFSLRYAFGVFRHLDAPYAEETRLSTGLRDAVASTFVYIGTRGDMFNTQKDYYTLFDGESDKLTFVSTKPMILAGPALCRLSLRDNSVILEEASLYAKDSNYQNPSFETKERRESVIFAHASALQLEYFQGDKRLDSLKEDLPTLVKITVVSDEGLREFYCRPGSDFSDKKMFLKGLHEPN